MLLQQTRASGVNSFRPVLICHSLGVLMALMTGWSVAFSEVLDVSGSKKKKKVFLKKVQTLGLRNFKKHEPILGRKSSDVNLNY